MEPTFASMFAGCGGGDLGLIRAGWCCVWANEIDKYSSQIYRKNFGGKHLVEGDIREIPEKEIPAHTLLIAGFPCQSFSLAGKREGTKSSRGTLFAQIVRVAKAKKPPLLLLENVKGFLSSDNGRDFAKVLRSLGSMGYLLEGQVLNSRYFGVPQNRERIFIIGHLGGKSSRTIFPVGCNGEEDNEIGEVAGTLQGGGHSGGLHSNMTALVIADRTRSYAGLGRNFESPKPVSNALSGVQKDNLLVLNHAPRCGNPKIGGTEPLVKNNECFAVDSSPHYLLGSRIRRFTPKECERLQGFPDDWTSGVSDTQRYKMLGNAMTVPVIEFLGSQLLACKTEGK